MKTRFIALLFLLATTVASSAQEAKKNELGLLLGWQFAPSLTIDSATLVPERNVDIGSGIAFQATYARHLTGNGAAALYFELPFVASPRQDLQSGTGTLPDHYASLYITPGLRLKFRPNSGISPWLSVGGGYARFSEAESLLNGAANPGATGTNKGAVQFGGGLDFKTPVRILLPIGLRIEFRDFFSGKPNYNLSTSGGFQHNLVAGGGFTVSF